MTKALAIVALALVTWLSLAGTPLPGPWFRLVPDALVPDDVVKHLAMFAVLTLVCLWAGKCRGTGLHIVMALMGLAVMLEVLQILAPARQFHLEELLANGAGVALGAGLACLRRRRRAGPAP